MPSTTSRGNYYKGKTKKYYEALGYQVQLTEFTTMLLIGGRKIYKKIDIFGSDMIAMNDRDIIFINSKHAMTRESYNQVVYQGRKEFKKYRFPSFVKLELAVWETRKPPTIIPCG